MPRDPWDGVGESGENDALMISLPELSKRAGVPAAAAVRLSREHPEEIPSVVLGGQQFFPLGAVQRLQEIYEREGGRAGGLDGGRPGLRSLARIRREAEEDERQRAAREQEPSEAQSADASPEASSDGEAAREGRDAGGGSARETDAGGELSAAELADAAERLAQIEARTGALVEELRRALSEGQERYEVEICLLDETWEERR